MIVSSDCCIFVTPYRTLYTTLQLPNSGKAIWRALASFLPTYNYIQFRDLLKTVAVATVALSSVGKNFDDFKVVHVDEKTMWAIRAKLARCSKTQVRPKFMLTTDPILNGILQRIEQEIGTLEVYTCDANDIDKLVEVVASAEA